MAGVLAVAPTLGGILGAGAAWAGKQILQAFLTQKLGGMFAPKQGKKSEEDEMFKKRQPREPYVPPNAQPVNPVGTVRRGALQDNPILSTFLRGYS